MTTLETAVAHPELAAEDQHLRATLERLEARIEAVGSTRVQGFTPHDTAALHAALVKVHQGLTAARQQVYFGRLDFTPLGGAPETYYLGKTGFDHNGRIVVVDWRAPVARLFTRRRPGRHAYVTPDGEAAVRLHLKRHLIVERADLRAVFDEYDARPGTPAAAERPGLIDPDAFLRAILSGRGAAQLHDIVATIQEHQDDLIRAEPRQVLVVQGAAGSGKTTIALHRVAFLLYPGNNTGIEAQRCIIFGPNQLFLGFIANVLPGLGVAGIPQTTLEAWTLERLGLAGHATADATLDALLSSLVAEAEKQRLARRSRLKASLTMGRLLDRLVDAWRARFKPPPEGLVFAGLGPLKVTVSLPRDRALELQRGLAQLPLQRQRERFVENALAELMGGYAAAFDAALDEQAAEAETLRQRQRQALAEAERLEGYAAYAHQHGDLELEEAEAAPALLAGASGLRALAAFLGRQAQRAQLRAERLRAETAEPGRRQAVRDALALALEDVLQRAWPPLDPLPAYRALLGDLHQLARLGRGLLDTEALELLHGSQPAEAEPLDVTDLPALAYLHTAVFGVPVAPYDHIVVDEAQDVAPLYYAVLRRFARHASLTVLGDTAQSVYAYRGLRDWDEAQAALEGLPYSFHDVRESYRSTHEIIQFANRLLELLAPPGQAPRLARPFERHGPPVRLHTVPGSAGLVPALLAVVAELEQAGYRNVAVIGRTPAACRALARQVAGADGQAAGAFQLVTAADQPYAGGRLILPVHLAKGMEFEAVLIVGADERTYTSGEFDGRLLYVAATRALHALHLFAVRAPNALLELALGA